ncbi:VOC family protein [Teichococcus deserti]|nr:VOC family protein [Pseudoroseomonas deserti]
MSTMPGIDHPLVLVRDIERARGFYARLGFTMTPVGLHPWGTSTTLAVLERSLLEVMSVYDESLTGGYGTGDFFFGRHMQEALAEREGLSLVALHSKDAAGDRADMASRGIEPSGAIHFRRRVKVPGGDWDEAVVELEVLRDKALPRVSHFLCQQHKPELIWVPSWMQHANTARYIGAVTYRAPDPAPVLARLSAMFGGVAPVEHAFGWEVATGQGVFRVLRPGAWGAVFADAPQPVMASEENAGAAIDIAVADLAAARRVLAEAGIETCETPGGPAVRDITACGNALIRFVPAPMG